MASFLRGVPEDNYMLHNTLLLNENTLVIDAYIGELPTSKTDTDAAQPTEISSLSLSKIPLPLSSHSLRHFIFAKTVFLPCWSGCVVF